MKHLIAASLSPSNGNSEEFLRNILIRQKVAIYGIALWLLGISFFIAPIALPWIFAVLAFFIPQLRTNVFAAILVFVAIAALISAQKLEGDTASYIQAFLALSEEEPVLEVAYRWTASIEPVFWYVTHWLKLIVGESERIFLFFWALLSLGAMIIGFRLVSIKAFPIAFALFSSTIYLHYAFGNAMRQGAAIGLLILALGFLCQKRQHLAQIFAFIAVGCHLTAIVILPFYFIKFIFSRFGYVQLIAIAIITIIAFGFYVMWPVAGVDLLATLLDKKTEKYFNSPAFISNILSFNSIRMLLFGVVVTFALYTGALRSAQFKWVVGFTVYIFMLQMVFSGSEVLWNRLSLYRMPAEYLAYAMILVETRKDWPVELFVLLLIPVYAVASGMAALGVESYLNHGGQTFVSVLAGFFG